MELAKETARLIAEEAMHLADDQAKAARRKFADGSLSKGSLERMIDLAKSLVMVDDKKLDADPWLLNTLTGTIDLRTGDCDNHDPCDLLTKIVPVSADRTAKCPQFRKFLMRVTGGDRALIKYIKKCAGYSLTGSTQEQVFFFCYGKSGSNGKSTLVNLMRDMLGDYSRHTPTETLLSKQYDNNIPADLARLSGVRMVTIEANFDCHLDEAKLKSMTGGEPITARLCGKTILSSPPPSNCGSWQTTCRAFAALTLHSGVACVSFLLKRRYPTQRRIPNFQKNCDKKCPASWLGQFAAVSNGVPKA